MPKFTDKNGNTVYYWEEWPVPDSDRSDLVFPVAKEVVTIMHKRNEIIADREILDSRGIWTFTWGHITQSEMQSLQTYIEFDYFRYYPDGQGQVFWRVYIPKQNGWNVKPERGGLFTVTMVLKEYGAAITSSSSSSST